MNINFSVVIVNVKVVLVNIYEGSKKNQKKIG